MEFKQILDLINAVDKSSLTRFSYKEGNTKIEFEKNLEQFKENILEKNITCEDKVKEDCENEEFQYIKSPLIGTFYNSPSPTEKPFISIGDKILKGQVVGIIEVMKVMNEVKSKFDGIVEDILIEDNENVEYGQCLIKIKGI